MISVRVLIHTLGEILVIVTAALFDWRLGLGAIGIALVLEAREAAR